MNGSWLNGNTILIDSVGRYYLIVLKVTQQTREVEIGLMSGQRLRWWFRVKPALAQRLMYAGKAANLWKNNDVLVWRLVN